MRNTDTVCVGNALLVHENHEVYTYKQAHISLYLNTLRDTTADALWFFYGEMITHDRFFIFILRYKATLTFDYHSEAMQVKKSDGMRMSYEPHWSSINTSHYPCFISPSTKANRYYRGLLTAI